MKFFSLLSLWFLSLLAVSIYTYEHPEKIEEIKNLYKKNKKPKIEIKNTNEEENFQFIANSYNVNVEKILSIENKTSFITYLDSYKNFKFNSDNLTIFTQNGFKINKTISEKLNLPNYFTLERNGGVKTIIAFEDIYIALISGKEKNCAFAALVNTSNGKELFRTRCLPEEAKNNDFNGLGSSNVHTDNEIYFTLGTPEKHLSKNSQLAQDDESFFGKVLKINKLNLSNAILGKENLKIKVFSKGHRVPQGLTRLHDTLYSVEHGPKGGDELNLLLENGNYGWPKVSYGTNYLKIQGGDGKSIPVNHENNNYIEPLHAFLPSIGISALNNCPKKIKEFYKKKCLIALSLYGNNLRAGHSIIIILLNEKQDQLNSLEIIPLGNLALRHFVTNKKNELFEDQDGNIYLSADKKGIYKVSFINFR
jgi:hypothetical protein